MNHSADKGAKKVRVIRDAEILTPTVQTTTASYADVAGSKIDAAFAQSVAFTIKNTGGSNGATWKVLASIDDVTYVQVQAPANVAFGASDTYAVTTAPYRYYKAQVVDQVGGSHTTVVASAIAK